MELITEKQINKIVSIIRHQCDRIIERDSRNAIDYPDLEDDDYMSSRKHSDTASIYAGFQPGMDLEGLTVKKHKYGRGYWQPDIGNEEIIVQIYRGDNDLISQEIEAKTTDTRHYYIFKFFKQNKRPLTRIDLVDMDTRFVKEVYNAKNQQSSD